MWFRIPTKNTRQNVQTQTLEQEKTIKNETISDYIMKNKPKIYKSNEKVIMDRKIKDVFYNLHI